MENKILSYDEMKDKTKKYYKNLNINIPSFYIDCAIQSLTMAEYAKEFNDKNITIKINDHRALATVGDAVCAAYLMRKKYHISSTEEELTNYKKILTNECLNKIGEKMLIGSLFYRNNDLKDENGKSYATAFEAVIGFISILDLNKAFEVLDIYLVE